jgi:hypothetical protein
MKLQFGHTHSDTATAPAFNVAFGSKADICSAKRHVRFTPESGHVQRTNACPLSANNEHSKKTLRIDRRKLVPVSKLH